jgi:hypothetical protein
MTNSDPIQYGLHDDSDESRPVFRDIFMPRVRRVDFP